MLCLRNSLYTLQRCRDFRHCYTQRQKRFANPTYRYRPQVHQSSCSSTPSGIDPVTGNDGCQGSRQTSTGLPVPSLMPSATEIWKPSPLPDNRQQHSSGDEKLHKYLLLVTGQIYHEFIGECSIVTQARDLQDLGSMLQRQPAISGDIDNFVLVQVGTRWRLNVRLLDVLIDRLGNVSMYVDKKHYSKTMITHCCNIGVKCTLLTNLIPVLEQFESGAMPQPEADDHNMRMYDPDWISLPALPPLPRNFTHSTEKQIEYLTWRLCVRDRRHNLFYKLDYDSPLSAERYRHKKKKKHLNLQISVAVSLILSYPHTQLA